MQPEPLTPQELSALKAATSAEAWDRACDAVKSARGGMYPTDWYEKVLASGLAERVLSSFGSTSQIRVVSF